MKKSNQKLQLKPERVPRAVAAAVLASALSAFVLTGIPAFVSENSTLLSIMFLCAVFTVTAELTALPDSALITGSAAFICAGCVLFFVPIGEQSIYMSLIKGEGTQPAKLLTAALLLCGAVCLIVCVINRHFTMRCITACGLFLMLIVLIWLRYTLFTIPAILITAYILIVLCQICAPKSSLSSAAPRDMWFIMFSLLIAVIIFSIPTPDTRIQWEKLFEVRYSKELEQLSQVLDIDEISDSDDTMSESGYSEDQSDLGGWLEMASDIHLQVDFSDFHHGDRLTGSIYDCYTGKGWTCTADIVGTGYGTVTEKPSTLALPARYDRACVSVSDKISDTDIIRETVFYLPYSHDIVSDKTGESAARDGQHMAFDEVSCSDYTVYYYDEPCGYELTESEKEAYLSLPDKLPRRIKKLAQEAVEGCTDDESKLHSLMVIFNDYRYQTAVSNLPKGRDFVDYFLFTTKKGYCAYYASSLAVLARCAGIPSRYVQGYYIGSGGRSITVSSANAHAWAELYIDGKWIICDPITSPAEDIAGEAEEEKTKSESRQLRTVLLWSYIIIAVSIVVFILFMPLFRRLPRRIRIKRRYGSDRGYPVILQCEKLMWVLSACGVKKAEHETLSEFGMRMRSECKWLNDVTCEKLCCFFEQVNKVLYSSCEHTDSTDKKLARHIKKDYIRKHGLSAYLRGHRRASL